MALSASRWVMANVVKGSAETPVKKLNGLTKPYPVSRSLVRFFGVAEISRTMALKKIWEHVKARNLQDPKNKRQIICDEKLKSIFGGRSCVSMFEVSKLLAPHFIKPQ